MNTQPKPCPICGSPVVLMTTVQHECTNEECGWCDRDDYDKCPKCAGPIYEHLDGFTYCPNCHWRSDDPGPLSTLAFVLGLIGVVALVIYCIWR